MFFPSTRNAMLKERLRRRHIKRKNQGFGKAWHVSPPGCGTAPLTHAMVCQPDGRHQHRSDVDGHRLLGTHEGADLPARTVFRLRDGQSPSRPCVDTNQHFRFRMTRLSDSQFRLQNGIQSCHLAHQWRTVNQNIYTASLSQSVEQRHANESR